jgi:2-C-methyl-D-erythritol 4-phosphate cytidylyltransferase/2-C-methyl-D-erythritol 2,4-cyclodiphosphate synthase
LPKALKATDEAAALEMAGFRVKLVLGDEANVKITTLSDLSRINMVQPIIATGFGYDVHAFTDHADRKLVLGGVLFPENKGLAGHSDADVLIHAIVDAILGACGAGDIGHHFPDTDPQWKDADSMVFLRSAAQWAGEAGWQIDNIDATVLAESPKVAPERSEMCRRISEELGISQRMVNIKATTSEGLGAIGRGDGIAAMAVATLSRSR